MKKIKINFADFWDDFNPKDNFIMDALLKNFEPVISSDPDFVFCATFGRSHLKYSCVKIFFTGENLCPDFNIVDYAMGFHDITFDDRYLRLPLYALYNGAVDKALTKHEKCSDDDFDRKFCNYVISNAISDPARDEMIALLNSYKSVDSGGRYRNNVGGPVPDKIKFEEGYKFTMCFENTSAKGYTTEKIVEAFAGRTVPVYWGNPDIAKEFNGDSFINCHDFDSFEDVIDFIKKVDEDKELYLKMLNSPMCKDKESSALQILNENYLSDFLYKICSLQPEKAYRRNRIYQGKRYEDHARTHERLDAVLYYPRRLIYYIQNKIQIKRS